MQDTLALDIPIPVRTPAQAWLAHVNSAQANLSEAERGQLSAYLGCKVQLEGLMERDQRRLAQAGNAHETARKAIITHPLIRAAFALFRVSPAQLDRASTIASRERQAGYGDQITAQRQGEQRQLLQDLLRLETEVFDWGQNHFSPEAKQIWNEIGGRRETFPRFTDIGPVLSRQKTSTPQTPAL